MKANSWWTESSTDLFTLCKHTAQILIRYLRFQVLFGKENSYRRRFEVTAYRTEGGNFLFS